MKHPPPPKTALGLAIREKRGTTSSVVVATEIGITHTTLLALEQGKYRALVDTYVKIARWLGRSVEWVIEAARTTQEVKNENHG